MNNLTKVALVTVIIAVFLGLIYIQIEIQSIHSSLQPPKGKSSPTPKPTAPTTYSDISIGYNETSREDIANDTRRLTLTVNVIFINGSELSVDYSQFYLQLWAVRFVPTSIAGTTYPLNSGNFTLGNNQRAYSFQLTFEYNALSWNGIENGATYYVLEYNGPASVNWLTSRSPTP